MIDLDVSAVNGKSNSVVTDTGVLSYAIVANSICPEPIECSIKVSPTPATAGLIALDSTTAPTEIIFNPLTNLADAQ